MELREWQYINKPTMNSASTSSNTGFKKRLEKLIKYHGNNLPIDVDYLMVGLLTKDKLEFTEQYDDGHVEECKISIDPTSEDWQVRIFVNRQLDEELKGTGWPELLKTLRPYIVVPETRELEYKNLLTEWVAMNNKTNSTTSTGSYKKRFEKLIKYHIDHASSELERVIRKDIKDYGFHLSEHYNNGHDEFDSDIIVSIDKNNDWSFSVFLDGKETDSKAGNSWEDLIRALSFYFNTPNVGTQEYDDLLTEWVAIKNSNTSSQPASTKTTKEKFKELTDYMIANANFTKAKTVYKADVPRLNDYGFSYTESASMNGDDFILTLIVDYSNKYNPASTAWKSELYMNTDLIKENKGNGMEELLQAIKGNFKVPTFGSSEYKSICESASSIAEDFKTYENLWN